MSSSIFAYECPIHLTQISLPFEPLDALAVQIIPARALRVEKSLKPGPKIFGGRNAHGLQPVSKAVLEEFSEIVDTQRLHQVSVGP